jgi:PAS domain S-box-containing protein
VINDRNTSCHERLRLVLLFVLLTFLSLGPPFARAEDRIVTVGIYENAPKIFTSESGHPSGIFIDIIEHIAKIEGWNLRYVSGTWGEGLDRLAKGEIDLMPDVAYTTEREKIYAFHKVPVLSSWFQVYALKGSKIQSILDLNGKRILVLERSVQQEAFARLSKGFGLNCSLFSVPDYSTMFEMVAKGEADAAIANRFYGRMHAKKLGVEDTTVVFEPSDLFFASPRNDHRRLLDTIDSHLLDFKKDPQSVYYRSLKQWTSEEIRLDIPGWLQLLGLVIGVALLTSLVGSFVLKHQVNVRTRELRQKDAERQAEHQRFMDIEEALHESEREYRELVMLANSIILRWSPDGRVIFLNEFGRQFFGYTEAEIVGRHVVGTIVPEDESGGRDLRPLMEEICADPKKFERNINENIRRNGERVWIDWTNKVVLDEQGQIKEILSIGSDITDRKQAEEQVRRLNDDLRRHAETLEQRVAERTVELAAAVEKAQAADRIKSAFLATMSHELRTPLNSIIGFTGILLQGLAGPLNPEQQKQLAMVQTSSRHLLSLINDVLDISKIEAGQLELAPTSFDLRVSMEKTVKLVAPLAEKKDVDLWLDISNAIGTITADQRRLEQVVLNLVNNAVKFTDKGHVHVSCSSENDHCLLSVSDTGIGMRPEELVGIFQPFHQIDTGLARKREGTGLGLSICKKIIDMMGGSIGVESRWEQGSTFTVRIPLQAGELP